ncbi:unnamed protein product, partial [Urochloa humidicola]
LSPRLAVGMVVWPAAGLVMAGVRRSSRGREPELLRPELARPELAQPELAPVAGAEEDGRSRRRSRSGAEEDRRAPSVRRRPDHCSLRPRRRDPAAARSLFPGFIPIDGIRRRAPSPLPRCGGGRRCAATEALGQGRRRTAAKAQPRRPATPVAHEPARRTTARSSEGAWPGPAAHGCGGTRARPAAYGRGGAQAGWPARRTAVRGPGSTRAGLSPGGEGLAGRRRHSVRGARCDPMVPVKIFFFFIF